MSASHPDADGCPGSSRRGAPSWHAALAYAITGERWTGLTESGVPEPARLAEEIAGRTPDGPDGLRRRVQRARSAGESWPYPVPDDLRTGLGAAQWLAALAEVRRRLELDRPSSLDRASSRVTADRPPDAAERRLLGERPPHHGS